jgi:choline dehydrogenase-like flavoprotein
MYKPEWLSKGVEVLLQEWEEKRNKKPYDVIIVGSGYGGAVAAARLAASQEKDTGRDLEVCVLERGREHLPGTFPNSFSELPGHMRFSRPDDPVAKGVRDGLFDLRIGKDVTVLVANGLGGGSLINAGVAVAPDDEVFVADWPSDIVKEWNGQGSLKGYFDTARQELGLASAKTEVLSKHAEFKKFAAKLNPKEAPITVDKDACMDCGDCATGCNFGAKRTLSTTYLEKAWKYGAEIYTGATVSHVEKRDGEWAVFVALTNEPRPLKKEAFREIRAKNVILAAGTLGSSEILMRSKARCRNFQVSATLGERFSTNGDMISVLYHQNRRVNAVPEETSELDKRKVGPTITAFARSGRTRQNGVVIEELAIPGALRRVFEELVTTSAMMERFGKPDGKDHLPLSERDPAVGAGDRLHSLRVDPAAVDPCAIERCQIFAAMGDDGAKGTLELVPGWDDPAHQGEVKDAAIRVHWPRAGEHDIYCEQDKQMLEAAAAVGGIYLRNPLWRPLPAGISGALSGKKPTGLLFSVHPLGGCRMADSAASGVVDHMGRVFDSATDGVHPGLLVLDGSIIPTALGINPLLTITAVAERAIALYGITRDWKKRQNPEKRHALPPKPSISKREAAKPIPTTVQFSERMTGEVEFSARPKKPMAAELTLHFDEVEVPAFLRDPLHPMKINNATLQVREPDSRTADPVQTAKLTGEVELLVRGATSEHARTLGALYAYGKTRAFADLRGKWDERQEKKRERNAGAASASQEHASRGVSRFLDWCWYWLMHLTLVLPHRWLLKFAQRYKKALGYIAVASHVGEIRYLFYKFKLAQDLRDRHGNLLLEANTELRGQKTLAYFTSTNPWRQLIDLKLTAHPEGKPCFKLGTLTVDPAYFFQGFASRLRITEQRDLPAAFMDLASLALFISRILLKIHFWSFRLPEYQKYDPMRDVRRLPAPLEGVRMDRYTVGYPATPRDAGVFLPITRYRSKEDCPQGPVVLFHGLGSGGIQFATPWVKPNMAQHLAAQGFDVWVAELRTSIALPYSADQWTIDEVARRDIPRIIDFVLEKTGKKQTKVVAHCIGSAMFCTAVLDGRLQDTSGKSKVESAVLLQVGPLITLSKGTRLRGLVAAPLRRFFPSGHVDFSVDDRAEWVESLIDRLLTTYPYPPEEAEHHKLGWDLEHNSHIANCNRWAAIDGRMFRHENLTDEMLGRLGEVLGHSSLTTWSQTIQYAFLERLTDSEAKNSYVTEGNVRQYFTFPVRFLHGSENDVFLPLTSRRSRELLKNVHGRRFPADLRILRGYGHFDPLIGKNAPVDVFPRISWFLKKDNWGWQPRPKPASRHYYLRRPLIGPVLGWVRQENKSWRARIWCRIDDLRSPAAFVVVQVFRDGKREQTRVVPDPKAQPPADGLESLVSGPIDTTLCLDIDLGPGPARCEVVVLSAHEALEQPPSQRLRQAEIAAGKPRSATKPHFSIADAAKALAPQVESSKGIRDYLAETSHYHPADAEHDDKIDRATIRIPEDDKSESLTLALASCRYPGWAFDRDRADAVFGELKTRLKPEDPAALLLVGDQIYADATAGAFDPKDRKERFYDAYREAWTARNAREVLSRVPVYMMMDDHEAGNDWHPEDRLGKEDSAMRSEGLEAFKNYQWVHSPGNNGQPNSVQGRQVFDYSFKIRGFPVFVCDTRSGRSSRDGILDGRQFDALTAWLWRAQRDREIGALPKFVVSPSVVVPFLKDAGKSGHPARSDGWDGFPDQLERLFAFILHERIENVVFLCGDSHLSMRSEIWFLDSNRTPESLKAWCIMASPMYAPYPFANSTPDEYFLNNIGRELKLSELGYMGYRVTDRASNNSFTSVTAEKDINGLWQLTSKFIPGEPVAQAVKPYECPEEVVSADAAVRVPVRTAA